MAKSIITDNYAIYNTDCVEGMKKMPNESVHFSIYSPPFGGLYCYSSSDEDLSNSKDYVEFFDHYRFVVEEKTRTTMNGRISVVHAADVPLKGDCQEDFPGDIIRLHRELGWKYHCRFCIWKEPLKVAIRTRSKGLMHKQIVKDSTLCRSAGADYLLVFRKNGVNPIPVIHPEGLKNYAGEKEVPKELDRFIGCKDPKTNKRAHWIWQQYASSFWDDIRINNVLEYKAARDPEDEKHCHPLQLDVVERCLILYTNPGEVVLTPFMGVGSEVYGAVILGRKGIGFELKESYFNQAEKNIRQAVSPQSEQPSLFGELING
jgi:DNA modification methylase